MGSKANIDQQQYAVVAYLEGNRSFQSIATEIGYSQRAVGRWVKRVRRHLILEAAATTTSLSPAEVLQQLISIGLFRSDGATDGNKSGGSWFERHGLQHLWNEVVRHTAFLINPKKGERFYCLANFITRRPQCEMHGCHNYVRFDSSNNGKGRGYRASCSPQHSYFAKRGKYQGPNSRLWKSDDHSYIDAYGYRNILDPLYQKGTKRHRFRCEHLVNLERHLGRRIIYPGEEIHHMNGIKVDNDPTNLFICTKDCHKQIEPTSYILSHAMLPLRKAQRDEVLRLLSPFKRLHGMFVQQELFDNWVAEGRITDWSEGPKADWELTRSEAHKQRYQQV